MRRLQHIITKPRPDALFTTLVKVEGLELTSDLIGFACSMMQVFFSFSHK